MAIMHIDANSAYLSWTAVKMLEEGYENDIREIPAAVAGDPKNRHGIILAKSIPAKKRGVRTGESLFEARRKCPELQVFPHDFPLYMSFSDEMYRIISEYSPVIQRYSVDECFMDYTGSERKFGDPVSCAHRIRRRIREELGFTVNIGVAENRLLAKMASDFKKPEGVHSLFSHEIADKMWPLPVEDLFMVGRATARRLHRININTIGDLAQADPGLLQRLFKSHGILIRQYANGIDPTPVVPNGEIPQKGLGNSTTVDHDVSTAEEAHMILLALTERVAGRLRRIKKFARIVSVTVTSSEFMRYGHQIKLDSPTDITSEIFLYVRRLFDEVWQGEKIRHLGVSLSELSGQCERNMSLFTEDRTEEMRAADSAVDQIREKFGSGAIMRGIFVNRDIEHMQGGLIKSKEGDSGYIMMGGRKA